MKKIMLFDPLIDGHHFFYNFNLAKSLSAKFEVTYCTSEELLNHEDYVESLRGHRIDYCTVRYIHRRNSVIRNLYEGMILFRVIVRCRRARYYRLHLVYFDQLYFPLLLDSVILRFALRRLRVSATCHWLPLQNAKWRILGRLFRSGVFERFFVHGDYILGELQNRLGHAIPVVSVEYPSNQPNMHDRQSCFKYLDIVPSASPILLCFGGLRYEKGIDIMIAALSLVKSDCRLIVAGEEQYFDRGSILELMARHRIPKERVILRTEYVSDEGMHYLFSLSDVVVLPYRRTFLGQSGPLIEGIAHGCVVVGPDIGQIGYTLKDESQGVTFECENAVDLSGTIEGVLERIRGEDRYRRPVDAGKYSIEKFGKVYARELSN